MEKIDGRTAFVTGGAQGIGLGIARALAREGVKVALADVDARALDTARAELSVLTPTEAFVLDVRDRDAFVRIADETERRLGPVSLLFNNAGVTGEGPVTSATYEMWDWVLGVNLMGVVNGVQTFVPRMIDRGGDGYVVNTASGAGLVVVGAGVMYTTSKFAVVGLSEALHNELARSRIGVSVLCPGYVDTGIVEHSVSLRPESVSGTGTVASRRKPRTVDRLAQGSSIDAVGEMVIAAMRDDRLYIYTDDMIAEFLEQRHHMLVDALSAVAPEKEEIP